MDEDLTRVKRKMETESNDTKFQKTECAINPAELMLNFARKCNAYENIPIAIDQFVHDYGKYKKEKNTEDASQSTQMMTKLAFETVLELDEEVYFKMKKLEPNGFWSFIPRPVSSALQSLAKSIKHLDLVPNQSVVPSTYVHWNEIQFDLEEDNDMVMVNKASAAKYDQNGARQLVSLPNQNRYEHYVTSSGKNPKIHKCIRSAFSKLHFLIKDCTVVMKSADRLDRVVFGAFRLRLYSENFKQLCEYWSTCENTCDESSFAYQEFQRVVETVTVAHCRENLYEMNKNADIVKKLGSLAGFLNDDFCKMFAIWCVCEIFDRFPLNYDDLHEKMCLEWLRDCCEILNYVFQNEYHPGVHSIDIRKGIDRLYEILSEMKVLFP
ncbi:uncharacterized protein LOC129226835 [Uloborus diversus]|uniref:uncharacterized protein LOC129226835 n=1 Tax=Uloborus diversus TaxID=327109 RepID=UPI00240907E8|nr:uncharacterized protein LOC129226835 [Uloborus diversus]